MSGRRRADVDEPAPMTELLVANGTVMFTDLVGFTEFNDAMGDAAAVEVLDRQLTIAAGAIEVCAGARVVKELGDGLMVWVPDASEALDAAHAFLGGVAAGRVTGSFPLAARVGVHYGEVVMRRDDLVGRTVNVAARITDLAGPGELLASDRTLRAAGTTPRAVGFVPIGPTAVRGVAEPIWLYRADDSVAR